MKSLRVLFGISFLFFLYFVYGIYVSQFELNGMKVNQGRLQTGPVYEIKGSTHSHSIAGIGSGSFSEVLAGAKAAGLNFVYITDLNRFERARFIESYRDNVLLLQGGKFSYLQSHLLYYRQQYSLDFKDLGEAQVFFTDQLSTEASETNEFITLANPFRRNLDWLEKASKGIHSIEVINLKEIWRNSWKDNKLGFVASFLFIYPFNPQYALMRVYQRPEREIALWDKMNQTQMVYGMLGNDVTAKMPFSPVFKIQFPTYKANFEIASNHLFLESELTGNAAKDESKIATALKRGNYYLCLDMLGSPKGFQAVLKQGDKEYLMGSKVQLQKGTQLKIQVPELIEEEFRVSVYKDGKLFHSSNSKNTELQILTEGVYRVEVQLRIQFPFPEGREWRDWIFTNPFFVSAKVQ